MQDGLRLHKQVRATLAGQIARGELRPGDRLPAERALTEQFGVARTVIRQALAALARDGMVVSAYPRGYLVLGPRIPWLPRLRPLSDEPWTVEVIDIRERPAPDKIAATLRLEIAETIGEHYFQLRGAETNEPWALGLQTVPLDDLDTDARKLLLSADIITEDDLEAAYGRRIVGYHETISARLTTKNERTALELGGTTAALLAITRTTRTTTNPICHLELAARADRFDIDYLTDA